MSNRIMTADNIQIPIVYKEIFLDNYRYFLLSSGRMSGKTSILVALWWLTINKFPDRDIVFLQATTVEIKDSIINEIKKFVFASGFEDDFSFPKKSNEIIWNGRKGKTYFFPITDSKGGMRTRGVATENPISLVLFEEAQKNKDANVVEQSVITFVRQMDEQAKLVIVGNNEAVGHWFIDYVNEKKTSDDWCYVYACYKDIWHLLDEATQKFILDAKAANEIEYRRIFLGDIHASTSDVVFPQFKRDKHYVKVGSENFPNQRIASLIVGVDHATTNDAFAAVPVAILDDGTALALEVLHDNPQETQITLSPVEQCDMLEEFLEYIDRKYGILYNQLKIILSIDGAAAPFRKQLLHAKRTSRNQKLWKQIELKAFTKKKKTENLSMLKNAFAYNVVKILNEGATTWKGMPNKHSFVKEIESQRYRAGELDKKIPNDLCDAFEYGLIPYYTNCYNMSFPIRIKNYREEAKINDIVKLSRSKI